MIDFGNLNVLEFLSMRGVQWCCDAICKMLKLASEVKHLFMKRDLYLLEEEKIGESAWELDAAKFGGGEVDAEKASGEKEEYGDDRGEFAAVERELLRFGLLGGGGVVLAIVLENTLIDFMHNLDRALKEYRNNELIADFKSQCSEPVMITSLEVYERSASCYFTRNIFKEIRNEIQRAGALNITVLSTTLDKVEFSVTALGDPAKDRRVEVDRGKNLFSCSCKLFELRGIPCSHIFCAMKFENILEFPDSLIYKRWTKNAKNKFISTEMPVNDDIERVLKFRVGALASNCNKLCDIACKDLADFDEVQSELVNLVIRLQSRKQGKSTPNVNVEGINDPFVVKSKGAPSKRSSWRKKRACSNCHKYGHYYKRCPDLMQHSVEGNPRDPSYGNASAKDSGFSPERFANSSRSFSIKSEHQSGPNTKPFKKVGTRKFTATGMRNRKGKDNTFVEWSLHESSESIDIASMNGVFNKNLYSLTQVNESQQDMRHSFKNYECANDVVDDKCDTRHVQIDVRDPLTSSLPCGNKQGSYMALFASMHRTL
ncbi:hypothetical protein AHAS_Ahas01G0237400 [Arachis hypogaea]